MGVVVLTELVFFTVSTLGGCGGLDRTDFQQFPLWEGMVILTDFIFCSFYFERVWWSWKNWYFTVSHLGVCGGLEITDFLTVSHLGGCGGLECTDYKQFLLWESVGVLKELILNMSELMYTTCNILPLLTMRWVYGGTSELKSTGPKFVPLLTTRCFYWGVHLSSDQPDLTYYWSCPPHPLQWM